MQIREEERSGATVVRLFGEFDSGTAPQVDTRLQALLREGRTVVVDFAGVPFMSSAGLRVLQRSAAAAQAGGGEVWLAGVTAAVRSVLQQTGFDRLLRSFPEVSDAITELDGRQAAAVKSQLPPPVVVKVEGDIDAATAPALERRLRATVNSGGARMVLDLAEVSYIASAGLRVLQTLLMIVRAQDGDVRLAGLQPEALRVLQTMGFAPLFQRYSTVDAAVASFG